MADGNTEYLTTLGPDASFKGELTFEKGLRIQGKFEGKINTAGKLLVAKEAKIQADVDAGAIVIEGEIKGNLSASDRVELKNTARYEGDLHANKLVVDEGAVFNGHVSVGPDATKPRPKADLGERRMVPQTIGPNAPIGTGTPIGAPVGSKAQ
ncbi:MAG: bactofilin family protein [Tepidisphaeraceae bacterium]